MLDGDVSTLDKAGFAQSLEESSHPTWVLAGRSAMQISDPRHYRLLRARRERPRRRAAESGDEIAPSKVNAHLPLPRPRRLGISAHARLPRTGSRLQGEGLRPNRNRIIMR